MKKNDREKKSPHNFFHNPNFFFGNFVRKKISPISSQLLFLFRFAIHAGEKFQAPIPDWAAVELVEWLRAPRQLRRH